MSLSFLSAVRRFPVFLPSAKLAAAVMVAMVVAAPVAAQTTGMINVVAEKSFTFPMTATLNSNREWEITYSADLSVKFGELINNCKLDTAIPNDKCFINSPYIMRYGVLDRTTCFALGVLNGGMPVHSQATVQGIGGTMSITSWTQTLRTKPATSYCMAVYVADSASIYNKIPISTVSFITPADPSPPTPAWMPNPFNTGCGTETTLALVRQCFQCIGGGGTWSMSANTCGN